MKNREKKYTFAEISKKIWTYFLDVAILLLTTLLLNIGGAKILESTSSYKNKTAIVDEQISEIYQLEKDANLIDFISLDGKTKEDPISRDDMIKKYIFRQVALSYINDTEEDFKKNNVEEFEYKYGVASLENDYLAYFYVNYIPAHQNQGLIEINKDPMLYYINDVYRNFASDTNIFKIDGINYPVLRSHYGYSLYRYLILDEKNYQDGRNIYDNLATYFNKAMDNSLKLFKDYQAFINSYDVYIKNYSSLVDSSILLQFIVYSIAFVLILVILPICCRKNRTLGNLINRTELFDIHENKIKWYNILFKKMIDFISMYWITLIVSFFTIGMVGLGKNIIQIGNFGIPLFAFIIISMIVATASVVIGISREDKRCLSELVSKTIYISYYFEPIYTKENNKEKL